MEAPGEGGRSWEKERLGRAPWEGIWGHILKSELVGLKFSWAITILFPA